MLYDLTDARNGTETMHFSADNIERFNELNRSFCIAPQLLHLNLAAPFTLNTDASKIAIGAVLLQRDATGVVRAISFFPKKLLPAQRNYLTLKRE